MKEKVIQELKKHGFDVYMDGTLIMISCSAGNTELDAIHKLFKSIGYEGSFGIKYRSPDAIKKLLLTTPGDDNVEDSDDFTIEHDESHDNDKGHPSDNDKELYNANEASPFDQDPLSGDFEQMSLDSFMS